MIDAIFPVTVIVAAIVMSFITIARPTGDTRIVEYCGRYYPQIRTGWLTWGNMSKGAIDRVVTYGIPLRFLTQSDPNEAIEFYNVEQAVEWLARFDATAKEGRDRYFEKVRRERDFQTGPKKVVDR